VQKGQVLATLDDREIAAEINKLKIERNLLQIKEQRQKQLLNAEAGTKADYDLALNALQSLDAQINLLEVTPVGKPVLSKGAAEIFA
jgi:membrane fusion protein (multidrug efflux system)